MPLIREACLDYLLILMFLSLAIFSCFRLGLPQENLPTLIDSMREIYKYISRLNRLGLLKENPLTLIDSMREIYKYIGRLKQAHCSLHN